MNREREFLWFGSRGLLCILSSGNRAQWKERNVFLSLGTCREQQVVCCGCSAVYEGSSGLGEPWLPGVEEPVSMGKGVWTARSHRRTCDDSRPALGKLISQWKGEWNRAHRIKSKQPRDRQVDQIRRERMKAVYGICQGKLLRRKRSRSQIYIREMTSFDGKEDEEEEEHNNLPHYWLQSINRSWNHFSGLQPVAQSRY